MSDLKIAVGGTDYLTELSTTQIAIANATNAFTLATVSAGTVGTTGITGYIATLTFASAHGLTFSPSAGTLGNYFIKFASATVTGGTGVLSGNVFRILTIPSTTTLTFFTTVSAATFSGASVIPVFYPLFQAALLSGTAQFYWNNAATAVVTPQYPYYGSVQCANLTIGTNTAVYYNPDNTGVPLDPTTGLTPASAPTVRTLLAAGTAAGGQFRFGPYDYIAQTGTNATQTAYVSIVE
jgi:hypothetical protein